MARPRVFVSSTFYDLKHIRASLEVFIESLGFDAILFEKGDIAFHPDVSLDESCYREAANADVFVLIIGGRYGSASSSGKSIEDGDVKLYQSITRKEFETAQEGDVPTFILLDNAVAAEYQTYLKNRDNRSIVYAHVDSEGVFKLLDTIFERSRNNPVFHFERATQIETWLREQWAGLFRELLRARSQQKQLATLNAQVSELKSVNDTLKTYLEAVLNKVTPDNSDKIIKDQEDKLEKARADINLEISPFYRYLIAAGISDDRSREVISRPESADEAIEAVDAAIGGDDGKGGRDRFLRRSPAAQRDYNLARALLGRHHLNFAESFHTDVAETATRAKARRAGGKIPLPKERQGKAADQGDDPVDSDTPDK